VEASAAEERESESKGKPERGSRKRDSKMKISVNPCLIASKNDEERERRRWCSPQNKKGKSSAREVSWLSFVVGKTVPALENGRGGNFSTY